MNDSLFSALRIVAMALSADGKPDPQMTHWFFSLINMYGLTGEQRHQLHLDLSTPAELESLYSRVVHARDREKLLGWLRWALAHESGPHPGAKRTFEQIQNMGKDDDLSASYQALARDILESDRHNELWKELEQAGQFFSRPVNYWWWRWDLDLSVLRGLRSGNRFIIGTLILFVVVLLFLGLYLSSTSLNW